MYLYKHTQTSKFKRVKFRMVKMEAETQIMTRRVNDINAPHSENSLFAEW